MTPRNPVAENKRYTLIKLPLQKSFFQEVLGYRIGNFSRRLIQDIAITN